MSNESKDFKNIPKRIANKLMNSLKGGVVPRDGAEYIAVGRSEELEAILRDIEIIEEGGATFRFIVGEFGAGKSFLFSIIRSHVTKKGFLVMDADFSPERRLCGTKNEGLSTYRELITNMCSAARPEGGALAVVLEKWVNQLRFEAIDNNISDEERILWAKKQIYKRFSSLRDMIHGYEFAKLIEQYYIAYENDDDEKKDQIIKWLRGEYQYKRDAKRDLGISLIITDDTWYDYLKLITQFAVSAGYKGVLILCDEMINLYKISNKISRQYNYEKLLSIYNDTLQGKAKYLGIIMGATPKSIEDSRRGIFSYEALRSRLVSGNLATKEMKDLLSPIIKIKKLDKEELFVLLERLYSLHKSLFDSSFSLDKGDLQTFLGAEFSQLGAEEKITPREIIRDFIELMNLLHQNHNTSVESILKDSGFVFSSPLNPDSDIEDPKDDEFSSFIL